MSDLDDLRAQEKATAGTFTRASERVAQYETKAVLARETMGKARHRLEGIRRKIKEIEDSRQVCLFEDEVGEKCTALASWKIRPVAGNSSPSGLPTGYIWLAAPSETTYACADHLGMQIYPERVTVERFEQ